MPQLDFAYYISQMFWFVICMTVFCLYVFIFAYPAVLKVFSQRKSLEDTLKSETNKIYTKIEVLEKSLKSKSEEIQSQIRIMHKESRIKGEELIQKSLKECKKIMAKMTEDSKSNLSIKFKKEQEKIENINKEASDFLLSVLKKEFTK